MKKLVMSLFALVLFVSAAMAQMDPMSPIPMEKELRTGVLPNGMTYYIRHNAKPKGQADFYIMHNVGAIQEADDQQGLAHFLEHMAFNGTKNLPGKQAINYLESIGVKFGTNLNAATSWDFTQYLIKDIPVAREGVIDSALLILHDWSHFIDPQPAEIDAERGVIKEELRTRDGAGWRSQMELIKAIGKGTKYEHRNLIGYLDFLESFPYDALTSFYHQWYRPEYQAVIVVGDIDVDQIESKIKTLMADIPASEEGVVAKEIYTVPANDEPIVSIYTDPEMTGTSINYIIKHDAFPREYNSTVAAYMTKIANMLIDNMQNARFSEIAMSPDAPFLNAGSSIGSIGIIPTLETLFSSVYTNNGEALEGLEAVLTELERTRRYGFTMGELERAKADLMSYSEQQYVNRNDNTNNFYVQRYVSNFSNNTSMPDAHTEWQMDSMIIQSLPLEAVNQMAQQYITHENQIIKLDAPEKEGLVNPTKEELLAVVDKVLASEIEPYEDDVVKVPLISPEAVLAGSQVVKSKENKILGTQEWTLKNGIKVVVKPSTLKSDEVLLSVTSHGGLSVLSDEDYFTGYNLNALLSTSGVGQFSSVELMKQLSGQNVSLSTQIGSYENGFSGSSSVKDVETMLQLLYLSFVEPRFNEDDFNAVMRQYQSYAENIETDPSYIMQKHIFGTLYGDNERANARVISKEKLAEVEFDNLDDVYSQLYSNAESFRFTIVGNVDIETLKPLVEKYIGSLPTEGKKLKRVNDKVNMVKGQETDDFKAPMQQPKVSVLAVYSGDIKYTLENKIKMTLFQMALDNIYLTTMREEAGGTYGAGVSASLKSYPKKNYNLYVQFDTNMDMADTLIALVEQGIEQIAEEGVSSEQMSKSREYLLKQHGNQLENNQGWMSVIGQWYEYGFDNVSDYENTLNDITSKDIQAIAKKILKDKNRTQVIMRPVVTRDAE